MTDSSPLLQGLHVVDLASWIAGPAAATVLSDFGADVIKVEPPGVGDTYRYFSQLPLSPHVPGFNYTWQLDNRNKRGMALNLKSPAARPVVERLVTWADVLVTNFPPPARAKFGLEYEQLAALNPRLIYADITGFGEVGPDAAQPGFDVTAYWARSGLMDVTRSRDAAPVPNVPGAGDHATAISLFASIMTALYRRERTGQGSRVTASLIAEGAWAAGCFLSGVLAGGATPLPPDRVHPANALTNVYRTADNRWLLLAFVNEDKQFPLFLQAIGHLEAAADPRFKDAATRLANRDEIVGLLDAEFAMRSLAECRELFASANLTYGIAQTFDEVAGDPQFIANNILVAIDDGSGQSRLTIDSPVHLDQEPKVAPRRAPDIGEHTEQILTELGFDSGMIANLRTAGVIEHAGDARMAA
jgi:crotonobetainyl-CoA:carnitine CoA-transferase CaiB-like acyl-CoA transferase